MIVARFSPARYAVPSFVRPTSGRLALAWCAAAALGPSAALVAQEDRGLGSTPSARVTLATTPPTIDGNLREPIWSGAPALEGFVQRVPRDGLPARERTELRVLFDESNIYVGAWLFDSRPEEIVEGEAIRDYDLGDSDAVVLIFDTFDDQQNAFVFGTNPAGIEYDGQVANSGSGGGFFFGGGGGGQGRRAQGGAGGGFNLNWDASWAVATTRDGNGWYAEFRIPFSSLRYGDGDDQTWGFNAVRRVRRLNEESFWSPVPREFNQYRLSFAGTLTGIDPPTRRLIRATPYLLGRAVRDYQAGDAEFSYPGDVGVDAKVQITQGLTLDATYNTDFAQVEVDDVQTNLTRFSLFFPEKRPFFLENAGFFRLGGGGAELFFSRRIGISSDGPVPILGGGRLSGRAGGLNLGLLHIATDEVAGGPPRNQYSAVRVARELPSRSRIGGAFFRRGSNLAHDWNRTYAIDGQLGVGESFTVSSFASRTETPDPETGQVRAGDLFDVSGGYTSRAARATAQFRQVDSDFNPELGFLPRDGYRYLQVFGMYYIRPERWGIREIRPHSSYFRYADVDTGFIETSRWHVDAHIEWENGMELHPAFNLVAEGLERPFAITDSITVPAGTYSGWEMALVWWTDASAPLSFNGGINAGNFLSGSRLNPYGAFTLRRGSNLSLGLRIDYNRVNLEEGDFDATLYGLRLAYFVTPRIYVQSLTQYQSQAEAWSTNVRLGWLDDAGSGLFVVYNHANTYGLAEGDVPLNRAFTIKYSRIFDVGW